MNHPEATKMALDILRKGDNFDWIIIPVLVVVMYIYFNELSKKNLGPNYYIDEAPRLDDRRPRGRSTPEIGADHGRLRLLDLPLQLFEAAGKGRVQCAQMPLAAPAGSIRPGRGLGGEEEAVRPLLFIALEMRPEADHAVG